MWWPKYFSYEIWENKSYNRKSLNVRLTSQFSIFKLGYVAGQIRVPEYLMGMLLNYVLEDSSITTTSRALWCSVHPGCMCAPRSHFLLWTAEKERVSRVESVHHPLHRAIQDFICGRQQQTSSFASSSGSRVAGSRGACMEGESRAVLRISLARARTHTRTNVALTAAARRRQAAESRCPSIYERSTKHYCTGSSSPRGSPMTRLCARNFYSSTTKT